MMPFSIRLTKEERTLAERYAEYHSCSLAEAFRRALFEKIEEEHDLIFPQDVRKENDGARKGHPETKTDE